MPIVIEFLKALSVEWDFNKRIRVYDRDRQISFNELVIDWIK